ncbi:phage-related minor tail protein [Caulobacter sp. BE264]|uniref:phage tail length tape measure family protein n=1 Tax=Caulobacter sp. BE264 TaxID=2817724 RepID=UPI002865C440|nr:phage tail length tape measure family protein [Caulobacter sp. BE264]MDR7232297.1 phage-related minor tail protein [Caulobacter sp. BE264]
MTVRQVGIRLKTDGKTEVRRDFQEIAQDGKAAGQAIVTGMNAGTTSLDKQAQALDRQTAKWRAMAAAAKAAQAQEEAAAASRAKLDAILGIGGGGKSAAASAEVFMGNSLSKQQLAGRLNLARQGADVFTTGFMGMNPGMIAIQQGPQIIDALATSGIKATPALIGVGAAVGGVAAAVAIAAVSQAKYESSLKGVEVATKGLGAASGLTAEQVTRQAEAAADANEISRSAAREFAAEYVSTGKIGMGVLQDLVGITKDYAATTRQDAAGATKELAAAFSDPARGASDLNDKLRFLSGAELEHIENLARAGREAEAQAILVDKLKGSLIDASDATTGWGRTADALKLKWDRVAEAVGRAVDRMVTGGDRSDRIAAAQKTIQDAAKALENEPEWARRIPGSAASLWEKRRQEAQAELTKLRAQEAADAAKAKQTMANEADADRKALVTRYNPGAARLAQAKADRDNLMRLGTPDEASRKALSELNKEIAALEKGYKNAGAAASALSKAQREAAKDSRDAARKAAEAKRDADDLELRRLREDVTVARIGGDASIIAAAEQELRLRETIIQRERDGMSATAARLEAERQISRELLAQAAALKAENSNVNLDKDGFVSAEARMAKALAEMSGVKAFSAKTALFEDLRVNTRLAFGDGLMEAAEGGDFFKVFTSRLKYAAASALVGIATDGLFGNRDGSKSGLISAAMKFFLPKNQYAAGTLSSAAGLALVGEKGPEIVDLPGGSRVFTAEETRRLAAASRAGMAGQALNVTYAPTYTINGGDEAAIKRLEAAQAQDRAEFAARTITTVQDALSRRILKAN